MKKYYIFFSLSVVAIFTLQAIYINSLYLNFIVAEEEDIEICIYQAIDLELHYRKVTDKSDVKYEIAIIPMDKMSSKMRDSLLAIYPLPKRPTTAKSNYNLIKLIDGGRIRNMGDIHASRDQDVMYRIGKPINAHILDSLFDVRLDRNYINRVSVLDSNDYLLSSSGSDFDYNYVSELIPIGLKKYQFVKLEVYIPFYTFFESHLLVFISSILILLIPLVSLIYLITTIRRRHNELEVRELSINGIIHDLKSPLNNVSAMLDYFNMTEKDEQKKDMLQKNYIGIGYLIKKVESLLAVARHNKGYVYVCKELIKGSELMERAEVLRTNLLLRYKEKGSTINISGCIDDSPLYIDTAHYDTVLANLMENALKYSGVGVIVTVNITVERENTIVINVEDNGFGISKKNMKYIFDLYYRVAQNGIKGDGIGLSYVKAVAKAHGGDAKVIKSVEGEGSSFQVSLNIEK